MENIINADSTMQTGTQYILHEPKEAIVQATSPIFDFTATFNAALAQAIHQATQHLHQRIAALEDKVKYIENHAAASDATVALSSRLALLEDKFDNPEKLNEERIKEIADEVARDVLSEHTDEYDHDMYDRLEDKLTDLVSEAFDDHDMDDKIREAIGGLTFSLRVA